MSKFRRNSRSMEDLASDPSTPSSVLLEIIERCALSMANGTFKAFTCLELCLENPGLNVVELCRRYKPFVDEYFGVSMLKVLENFATDMAMMDGSIGEVADKFCRHCASQISAIEVKSTSIGLMSVHSYKGGTHERIFLMSCADLREYEDAGRPIPNKVPESSYRKLAQIASMYLPDATRFGLQNNLFPSVMVKYMPITGNGYRRGKTRRLPRQEGLLPLR